MRLYEAELYHKDGRKITLEIREHLIEEHGKVAGTIGNAREITERKKAEDALQEAGEFNRQVIESAQEGIIVYGLDLKYQRWNPFMEQLTGLPAAEVLGRHPLEVFPFMREAGIMAVIEKALAGEVSEAERFQFHIPKTGRSGWASEIGAPLKNARGEIIGVIGTARDITEHRKLEDQLRHSQKMEAVGTLAGGIAHDFNNILNVIMGYGTMVMGTLEAGSPSKEHMNEVLIAADRAANLTKRLLVFSRKQVVEVKPININSLLLVLQKMLVRIINESIEFILELADRPLIVLADAGQIEQVLINLAGNARDAMQEGGRLTISTELKELDNDYVAAYGYGMPGRYALITVADTGQGMDAETQKKIFEPFFTTKGIGEGTGLGLSISYGIIKQHGGYIQVYSEPGHGTVFKIYLPLSDEAASPEMKAEAAVPVKGGNETVLVTEDDASLRELTRIILESFGYTVISAEDGEDAITKFMENRERISLVLIDMIMPKKNGKEVSEAMRKVNPRLKILFMSGYTMNIIKTEELTAAGFDFIHKPFQPTDLLIKVREVLDR
jgi:two-component system, cell cycle sensor histidine kinase and response regulator CckA